MEVCQKYFFIPSLNFTCDYSENFIDAFIDTSMDFYIRKSKICKISKKFFFYKWLVCFVLLSHSIEFQRKFLGNEKHEIIRNLFEMLDYFFFKTWYIRYSMGIDKGVEHASIRYKGNKFIFISHLAIKNRLLKNRTFGITHIMRKLIPFQYNLTPYFFNDWHLKDIS